MREHTGTGTGTGFDATSKLTLLRNQSKLNPTEFFVDCPAVPSIRPVDSEPFNIPIRAVLSIPPSQLARVEIGLIVGLAVGLLEPFPAGRSTDILRTGVSFTSNADGSFGTRGRTADTLDAVHPAVLFNVVLIYNDMIILLCILKDFGEQCIGAGPL